MHDLSLSLILRRMAVAIVCLAILFALASILAQHGEAFVQAVRQLAPAGLLSSLLLCTLHRAINSAGWGIALKATRQSIDSIAAARVWLASEACRWLPGSVWAYGSRTFLASRRGISSGAAAASLILEIGVTVGGWLIVFLMTLGQLHIPALRSLMGEGTFDVRKLIPIGIAIVITLMVLALLASRTQRVRSRVAKLSCEVAALRRVHLDSRQLILGTLFYAVMAVVSGVAFYLVLQSEPSGATVPIQTAIAANAVAWLAGFFAFLAPGGLVVREACLVALLSPWIPAETAIVIAFAWRLVQISAEIACSMVVMAWGLPESLLDQTRSTTKDMLPATYQAKP